MGNVTSVELDSKAPIEERERAVALIRAIAAGNKEALRRLYEQYHRILFGTLLRILNRPEAAEEVLQDTFVRAWKSAALYDPSRASPLGWLIMMARSLAIDRIRRRARQPETEDLAPLEQMLTSNELSADELAELGERARHLHQLLDCLPFEQRRSIELAFFKGYSQSEISKATNRPLGSVKSDIRRGLIRLRKFLSQHT